MSVNVLAQGNNRESSIEFELTLGLELIINDHLSINHMTQTITSPVELLRANFYIFETNLSGKLKQNLCSLFMNLHECLLYL